MSIAFKHILACASLFVCIVVLPKNALAQLTVDNNAPYDDPVYLVEQVLLGFGLNVTNVTFNGSALPPTGVEADMIGYFNGSGSNIGLAAGVIINTGNIYDAPGPNDSQSDGVDNLTPGDPDLDVLASLNAPTSTYNAAVLEFDFETVTDGISFRYVFASEEYNEFVCTQFNDVFGFFIWGPNPAGGMYNGLNIALVPNTSLPVGINTVNNGNFGSAGGSATYCPPDYMTNTAFYVDNEALGGQSVQYDGFTTVLTAQQDLVPCTTYHLKMAVADAGDGIYDSGVFLEAASFGAIGIQVEVGEVGSSSATLVEGCDSLLLIFTRAGSTIDSLTINYIITGSATNGVDYTLLPGSIVIPVGASQATFNIGAYLDGIPEGIETISITIPANLTNNTCLDDVPSTATVTIINTDPLELGISNDTIICPGNGYQIATSISGGIGAYTYSWSPNLGLSCGTCPNPIASPSESTTYTVTVTDECGTDIVTEQVVVNVGGLLLETGNTLVSIEGCSNATFTFTRIGSTADSYTVYFVISGGATNGVDYGFILDSIVIPAGQSTVDLTIFPFSDTLTEGTEQVTITTIPDTTGLCTSPELTSTLFIMDVLPLAVIAPPDTVVCGGASADLYAIGSGGVGLSYEWDDGVSVIGADADITVTPSNTTLYTVTVSDTCGNSIAFDQVLVTTTNPPSQILAIGDTAYEGCREGVFNIEISETSTSPTVVAFTISGSASNGVDFTTIPDSVIIGAGMLSTTITISSFQDGLPEGDETITITLPRDSIDSLCYNAPYQATVYIKNIDPIDVTVADELICPGDTATLLAQATGGNGVLQYIWSTGATTSSINVSPTATTIYSIEVADTCSNSFMLNPVTVDVRDPLGSIVTVSANAYEGCKNSSFEFSIPVPMGNDYVIYYSAGGSAQNGIDYEPIIDSIIIPAGSTTTTLEIEPIYDGTAEGSEMVEITIIPTTNDTTCPHIFIANLLINDVDPITLSVGGDTTVCNWQVYMNAMAVGGMGALTYDWSSNAGSGETVAVKPMEPTTYLVTVYDSCGSSVAYDSVSIDIDCEYLFHFPNSFTPNGDDLNDFFFGTGRGIKNYEMSIYNRWGDLIFKTTDRHIGWDGRSNGGKKISEQEVYIVVFETTDFLDYPHTYIGKIVLIQ
ncbi:MAG: hypothetical protein COB85_03975 [Bacteroidetes bacterium]|nr:MAG: hypothetical protein COB85_03975 [Bacteroidota bacterium]